MEENRRTWATWPQPIRALVGHIEEFSQPIEPGALRRFLMSEMLDYQAVEPWIKFDSASYSRNSVVAFPHAELLVMCWRPGQLSPIHNHSGSACDVRIISGVATEITYERTATGLLITSGQLKFCAGEVASSFDSDIHQIANLEQDGSDLVTLHCYSPPLNNMEIFK